MPPQPLRWQREVEEIVKEKRVVLVSSGRGFGASWLGAYLLLQESRKQEISFGVTPSWENQSLGERIEDLLGGQPHNMPLSSKRGKIVTFPPGTDSLRPADIVLTTPSNPTMALGHSSHYLPLTVFDSCGVGINPKLINSLIDRHMRVLVLGTLRKTSYRSSYFDLWFEAAWKGAAERDDWGTYHSVWYSSDVPNLTPEFAERLNLTIKDGQS